MKKGLLILAVALLVVAPVAASAQVHHRVVVVGAYGWGGPYWGPYSGWGPYWGPGWWGPPYYDRYANTGEIKLDAWAPNGQVFINGALLGDVHHNRSIHLRPGGYRVEIREPGRPSRTTNVYVAIGKTLHLRPER